MVKFQKLSLAELFWSYVRCKFLNDCMIFPTRERDDMCYLYTVVDICLERSEGYTGTRLVFSTDCIKCQSLLSLIFLQTNKATFEEKATRFCEGFCLQ